MMDASERFRHTWLGSSTAAMANLGEMVAIGMRRRMVVVAPAHGQETIGTNEASGEQPPVVRPQQGGVIYIMPCSAL